MGNCVIVLKACLVHVFVGCCRQLTLSLPSDGDGKRN